MAGGSLRKVFGYNVAVKASPGPAFTATVEHRRNFHNPSKVQPSEGPFLFPFLFPWNLRAHTGARLRGVFLPFRLPLFPCPSLCSL